MNIELNNSELNSLCEDFSNIVLNSVISSSYLPGVMEFIKKHKSDKKIFICTGTPQNEIDFILKYVLAIFTFGLVDNFGKDLLLNSWVTSVIGGVIPDNLVYQGFLTKA